MGGSAMAVPVAGAYGVCLTGCMGCGTHAAALWERCASVEGSATAAGPQLVSVLSGTGGSCVLNAQSGSCLLVGGLELVASSWASKMVRC
jgi:hypothetical protein